MNRLANLRHLKSGVKSSLLLANNERLTLNLLARSFSNTSAMNGGFSKDYKPGPYPKTEEERIAAAKKYGLRPEDYKPMANDGLGFGDYPELPKISADMKSPWEEYDDPYLRRNYNEPIPINQEQVTPEKVTYKNHIYSWSKVLFWHFLASFVFIGGMLYTWEYKHFVPLTPKQYPRNVANGEKHYAI